MYVVLVEGRCSVIELCFALGLLCTYLTFPLLMPIPIPQLLIPADTNAATFPN